MPCAHPLLPRTRALRVIPCLILTALAGLSSNAFAGSFAGRGLDTGSKAELIPIAVFGADERAPLDPRDAPLNDKIGVLVSRGASICTAFCVAPNAIATASHCLYGTEQTRAPDLEKVSFSVGAGVTSAMSRLEGGNAAGMRKNIQSGTSRLRVTPPIDAANDWAVVRLETPVCRAGGIALSEAPREEIESAAMDGGVYQVSMHRDVSAEALVAGKPCLIAREFPGAPGAAIARDFSASQSVLLHTCDTGPGSSGSPLLIDGPFGPEVVGINVGTYILSRMSEKNAEGVSHEVSAPIANTAIATGRFKSAVERLSVMTGTLRTGGPFGGAPRRRQMRPGEL